MTGRDGEGSRIDSPPASSIRKLILLPRGPWLLPLLCLGLPLILLLLPLIQRHVFYHEDLAYYFYGLRAQLRFSFLEGSLRQWNPWTSCGLPLLGDGQLAAFYPPNLLFYLLPTGLAFNFSFLFHFSLASWLSFRFFRALQRSIPAATLASLIFVWSGFFWAHLHHVTFLAAGAWLPAMLHAWLNLRQSGPRANALIRLAFPVGMATLAGGSPQILYLELLTLGSFALFTACWRPPSLSGPPSTRLDRLRALLPSGPASRALLGAVLAVGLGLLLASIQLLPFLQASHLRYPEHLSPLEFSASFALSPLALPRLLVPNLFGNDFYALGGQGFQGPGTWWESYCYLGILTLPLLILGAQGRGLPKYFATMLGLSMLASLGKLGLLHPLLVAILPLYARFRAPSRLFMLASLAAAFLAARGLDRLRTRLAPPSPDASPVPLPVLEPPLETPLLPPSDAALERLARLFGVFGVELWGLCGLILFWRDIPLHPVAAVGWGLALVYVFGARGLLLGALRGRLGPWPLSLPRLEWLALGFLLVDLLSVAVTYNHPVPAAEAEAVPPYLPVMQAQTGHQRVLTDRSAPLWLLNGGLELGYRNLRGYNPLNPARLVAFLEASDGVSPREGGISALLDEPLSPMLDLLSPQLLLTQRPRLEPHLRPVWVDPERQLRIYRSNRALPRAFLTASSQMVSPERRWEATRQAALMRPPPLVLEEEAPELRDVQAQALASSRVTWLEDGTDRVRLQVETPGRLALVLTDMVAPGWRAELDGQEVPLRVTWGVARAVAVPPGRHEVRFAYQTPGLGWGSALSGLGLLIMVGMGLASGRKMI